MRAVAVRAAVFLLGLVVLAGCSGPGDDPAADDEGQPTTADPGPRDAPGEDPGDGTAEDPAADDATEDEAAEDEAEEAAAPEPLPLEEVSLTLTPVADSREPVAGAVAPDGTLFIAERAGLVRPLADEGLGEPVLDLSGETTTESERGLLGIAFDDSRLYVSFTDSAGDSRVDAFEWDGAAPRRDTREVLLEVAQPARNHNGGDLVIGPDGMLWLGLGDGGGAGDPFGTGQDPASPLGALLRLDPATGGPAAGNPFSADEADPRVWGYGLRNPWRFSFDAGTGELWIADVGQADREEINWVPAGQGAGANFGWPLMEGTMPFAGSEPDDHWAPIHEYETRVDGCAITGGYVYRGTAIDGLQGAYLFSDYCDGGLRALRHDDGAVTETIDFGVEGAGQVVSFAQDAGGELYVLTFGDGILRLDPS